MKFNELKAKELRCIIRYIPKIDSFRAKNRGDHIVGIMIGGESFHDFGYKSFTVSPGSVFFFNQRDDYDVRVLERGESLSIHFTTYEPIDCDSFSIDAAGNAEFLSVLEKTEIKSRRYGLNDCATVSLFYRFCGELARLSEKQYSQKDSRISAAGEYIDSHFREKDCLSAAVALSGVSNRRFNDIFKSSFGITPNRYIVLKKVQYAKELLSSGSFSVSEVAEICGFCDVYYFSRVFKAETGVPPKAWG